ncbi:protein takeout-like [Cimex lectularius]|uniref:Takeout n=1 Tax=Cimex lectularius TaxID=79782 RepID=A0A8I6RIZ7_CIMLE|nr:protein takeout-like [Cimex lectularius]
MLLHLLLCLTFPLTFAGKLPAGTVFCKRKDPNLNSCLQDAIQKSLSQYLSGVAELGLESIDPLTINHLVIDKKKDNGNPVDIDLSWSDFTITGIKSAVITSAKADWDNGFVSFEAEMTDPVEIKGNYAIDGIILIIPIHGQGAFVCKLEKFKAHIKVHGTEMEKEGKKYLQVDRLVFTFDIGLLTLNYENLFNGDKVLGDTMNKFLNENWKDILDEMKVSIETNFSQHFQTIAEKVFHEVPIDEIALP